VEKFNGTELVHYLAQSGLEDMNAWTAALLQAATTDSSAVAVTKVCFAAFEPILFFFLFFFFFSFFFH
jgi:hypothetical protein